MNLFTNRQTHRLQKQTYAYIFDSQYSSVYNMELNFIVHISFWLLSFTAMQDGLF